MTNIFYFDVETSGFRKKDLPADHLSQGWTCQIGFVYEADGKPLNSGCFIVRPTHALNRSINPRAQDVHGISMDIVKAHGVAEFTMAKLFDELFQKTDLVICHNYAFDSKFMADLLERHAFDPVRFATIPHFCTMKETTDLLCLPGRYPGKYKWPKLEELYFFLFGEQFDNAHDAMADITATRRCYLELKQWEQGSASSMG